MPNIKKADQVTAPMATLEREGALALIEWPVFLALRLKTLEPHLELTETGQELLQAARMARNSDVPDKSESLEETHALASGASPSLADISPNPNRKPLSTRSTSSQGEPTAATKHIDDVPVPSDEPQMIPLAQINWRGGTQARIKGIDRATVEVYEAAMRAGAKFPPIVVYWDGTTLWPADGFHRGAAQHQLGSIRIAAIVRQGTRRDAVLFGLKANGSHGLRYSNDDKRNAIRLVLRDPQSAGLSDRQVALLCGVDHKTVGAVRRALILTGERQQAAPGDLTRSSRTASNQKNSKNSAAATTKTRSEGLHLPRGTQ